MTELKPCPFCGGNNISVKYRSITEAWKVFCYDCNAEGPDSSIDNIAIEKWNTRPGERAAAVAGWEWWDNPEDDAAFNGLCAEPTPPAEEARA